MATPFPGVDPYLEHSSLWPDVHNTLVATLRNHLVAILRPRYAVLLEERCYLNECNGNARVPDRISEVWLEVRIPGTGEVVTMIELLSPTNKRPGSEGRRLYEDRRHTVLGTQTHLVEIDLCRSGVPMPVIGTPLNSDYRILISRGDRRPHAELLPFGLQDPIPGFRMPLRSGDAEPLVDLGALLRRAYDDAGYELAIDYRSDPVPEVQPKQRPWLETLLRQAGRR